MNVLGPSHLDMAKVKQSISSGAMSRPGPTKAFALNLGESTHAQGGLDCDPFTSPGVSSSKSLGMLYAPVSLFGHVQS